MVMIRIGRVFLVLLSSVWLAGCVTGTRSIELPAIAPTAVHRVDEAIAIGEVTDARQFETAPRDPSTPSARSNGATLAADARARLIGRQRNGYGKAMGDIALAGDGTVQDEVRRLIGEGLASRGYRVVESGATPNRVDVVVDEFWAWFTPGMWAVRFEARVNTQLAFETPNGRKQVRVSGHGSNSGQVASDANWVLAYRRAFEDYLQNLEKALDEAGL
jgi:uncharacterized lipoprotein YajG